MLVGEVGTRDGYVRVEREGEGVIYRKEENSAKADETPALVECPRRCKTQLTQLDNRAVAS